MAEIGCNLDDAVRASARADFSLETFMRLADSFLNTRLCILMSFSFAAPLSFFFVALSIDG